MIADRHVVMGAGGTAITSRSAVLLVDATPDSDAVRRSESALDEAIDPGALADRLVDAHDSFAVAVSAADGVVVIVAGEGLATIVDGDEVRHRSGEGAWTSAVAAADGRIVLTLPGSSDPTGQWLTTGVIAAGAVAVGRLRPMEPRPATVAPTPTRAADPGAASTPSAARAPNATPPSDPRSAVRRPVGGADDIDFGSLVGPRSHAAGGSASHGVVSSASLDDVAAGEPEAAVAPGRVERTDPTAAYVPDVEPAPDVDAGATRGAADPAAHLRVGGLVFSDGQRASLDAPVVVGRRPPSDPVAGTAPHQVTVDDRLLSRHHATFRLLDGHLVVVDEESTNGTFLTLADGARERCAAGRPIEVPAGATVDIGGVVTVTHDRGARQPGSSSC